MKAALTLFSIALIFVLPAKADDFIAYEGESGPGNWTRSQLIEQKEV